MKREEGEFREGERRWDSFLEPTKEKAAVFQVLQLGELHRVVEKPKEKKGG